MADDDPLVREAAVITLEDAGYETIVATDGREAVELFRRSPKTIDLLLLDVAMPALNGHEAYREIAAIAPKVPVLFCSVRATRQPAGRARSQAKRILRWASRTASTNCCVPSAMCLRHRERNRR